MTSTTHPEWNQYTEALEVAAAFPDAIKGKTILVTGVNKGGIGYTAAEAFASQSPRLLILAGRNIAKLQECIDALKAAYPTVTYRPLILDLSSQSAVRTAAKEFLSWSDVPQLDLLINNAGIMNLPSRTLSPDGLEMQFATNYVGHFLFTNLIISRLIAAAAKAPRKGTVRIINVSSRGVTYSPVRFSDLNFDKLPAELPDAEKPPQERLERMAVMYGIPVDGAYVPMVAYGQSKTANIYLSLALTERLYEKYGILSLGLHPGVIKTELARYSDQEKVAAVFDTFVKTGLYLKTLRQGSSTTLTAAVDPKLGVPVKGGEGRGEGDWTKEAKSVGENWEGRGAFLADCQIVGDVPLWVTSWEAAERLWVRSEQLVGEKFSYEAGKIML